MLKEQTLDELIVAIDHAREQLPSATAINRAIAALPEPRRSYAQQLFNVVAVVDAVFDTAFDAFEKAAMNDFTPVP